MTTSGNPYRFDIQTGLVQQVILEGDLQLGPRVFAVPNPVTGLAEAIIGDTANAKYIRRDSTSDTGWVELTLPFSVAELFVTPPNGAVYIREYNGQGAPAQTLMSLSYDTTNLTWTVGSSVTSLMNCPWQQVVPFQCGSQTAVMSVATSGPQLHDRARIARHLAAERNGGRVPAPDVALAAPGTPEAVGAGTWEIFAQGGPYIFNSDITALANDPSPSMALFNTMGSGKTMFFIDASGTVACGMAVGGIFGQGFAVVPNGLPSQSFLAQAAAVAYTPGSMEAVIVALAADGSLWSTGLLDSWTPWQCISADSELSTKQFSSFRVLTDAYEAVHVLARGTDGSLTHIATQPSTINDWMQPVEIMAPGVVSGFDAIYTSATQFDGTDLFVVTAGGVLFHLWLACEANATWQQETIEQQAGGVAHQLPVYRTNIRVLDADDRPAANVPLAISTNRPVTAFRGLNNCLLSSVATTFTTDGSGNVNLALLVSSLSAPEIILQSADILGSGHLVIMPDAPSQTMLANVSSDQLASGQNPLTSPPTPLVAASQLNDVSQVQKAITRMMGFEAADLEPDPNAAPFLAPTSYRRGIRYPSLSGIAPTAQPAIPDGGFTLRRSNGHIVYTELTGDDARALRAAGGVLDGIFDDVIEWLEEKAETVYELSVTVVNKAWELVVSIGNQVYQLYVETRDQAFAVVQLALDMLGAALGTAMGWILDQLGLFTDWKVVTANKDAIKASVTAALKTFGSKIDLGPIRADTQAFMNGIENQIDAFVTGLQNSAPAQKPPRTVQSPETEVLQLFEKIGTLTTMPATYIIDQLVQALPELAFVNNVFPPSMQTAFQNLLNAMNASQAITPTVLGDAVNVIDGWAKGSSESFTGLSLSTIIGQLHQLADAVVDFVGGIVGAIFDFLQAIVDGASDLVAALDQPIELPFIGAFYQAFVGNALSMLDVICLAVALPFTIIEAAAAKAEGRAPRAAGGMDMAMESVLAMWLWTVVIAFLNLVPGTPAAPALSLAASCMSLVALSASISKVPTFGADMLTFWITGVTVQLVNSLACIEAMVAKKLVNLLGKAVPPMVSTLGGLVLLLEVVSFAKEGYPTTQEEGEEYGAKAMTAFVGLTKLRLAAQAEPNPEIDIPAAAIDTAFGMFATVLHGLSNGVIQLPKAATAPAYASPAGASLAIA